MSRYVKRKFTAEAVVVGNVIALVIGAIVGMAADLFTQCAWVGLAVFTVTFLFSLDILFRSRHE